MANPFSKYFINLESPINAAYKITPNDAIPVGTVTRAIIVDTTCTLNVAFVGSNTVNLLLPFAANIIYPYMLERVSANGSSNTAQIWGLY